MSFVPFAGVDRRVAWLRGILLAACFVTLLASWPLWLNERVFPVLPLTPHFPVLTSPWDKCFFGALLLSLVLAFWHYRPSVTFFLIASLFAFCQDQNRGQPWFYMYWVMLAFTLLPANAVLAACRCALSAAYFWSGIQKCNSRFFQVVPAWFVAPAVKWHFPTWLVTILHWSVATAPFVEIAIAIALWSTRFRPLGIAMVLLIHLTALLFLGPLGYRYDLVVWPWNLAMIGMVLALFGWLPKRVDPAPRGPETKTSQHWSSAFRASLLGETLAVLRRSALAVTLVALFWLLPLLSFAGLWDSYFSFTLFAESQAKADIFVTEAFRNRLPPGIGAHVHKLKPAYDPRIQGPYVFDFQTWGYQNLRVPPIFEPRSYRSIFRYLRQWSRERGDLRMIVAPRAGPTTFYEGDAVIPLIPTR
jgi:hypothetical protein